MESFDVDVDGRGMLAAIEILTPAILKPGICANRLFSLGNESTTASRVSSSARRDAYRFALARLPKEDSISLAAKE